MTEKPALPPLRSVSINGNYMPERYRLRNTLMGFGPAVLEELVESSIDGTAKWRRAVFPVEVVRAEK